MMAEDIIFAETLTKTQKAPGATQLTLHKNLTTARFLIVLKPLKL